MSTQRWQELLSAPSLVKAKGPKVLSHAEKFIALIESGDVLALQEWAAQGENIHAPISANKPTPLVYAIGANQTQMVQALVDLGAKLNPKDPEMVFLWQTVASHDNIPLFELLYQSGARPWDTEDYEDWWNPKNWITKSPNLAKHWLDKGYEPDFGASHFFEKKEVLELLWSIDSVCIAWVLFLEQCKDKQEVDHYRAKLESSDIYQKYFDTALAKHWASLVEHNRCLQLSSLIEKGLYYPQEKLSIDERGVAKIVRQKTKPLVTLALSKNAYKSLHWFLESDTLAHEFVQDWRHSPDPPIRLLAWCDLDTLKRLDQCGLDWSKQDAVGNTVLHCKAKDKKEWEKNWKKWISILHPGLALVNEEGKTPLHILFSDPAQKQSQIQEHLALIEKVHLEKLPKAQHHKPSSRI